MIVVRALDKVVKTADGELAILKGLDLEIKAGETVAIVGASGSGKSTLLGLLAGLDDATSGEIWIRGQLLTRMSEEERAGLRAELIGFVFQNFQLLPSLTALENVMLPLELLKQHDAKARASALLARVGLGHRHSHYPRQLSGGEQQRVAIARAFVTRPAILFADEPTGSLDRKNAHLIADLLFDLNASNHTTLILVTHDMRLAERCQKIFWMDEGKLSPQEPELKVVPA